MDLERFAGFYIVGASDRKDAERGKGLILWSHKKPGRIVRFFDRILLSIYWVDKNVYEVHKRKMEELNEHLNNPVTEMPKHSAYKDGPIKKNTSTKRSSRGNFTKE